MTDYTEHLHENLAGSAVARIKKGGARAFKAGGLWIYDNEIDRVRGTFEDGDILAVEDFDGYFLGWGFINRSSKISIRMLSRKKDQAITPAFLEARVRAAWDYRKKVIDTSSCRVIFGEADFLPGITVDKYEDVLVVESLALGIERLKPLILSALTKVLAEDGVRIRGIYERSDAKVREKEGLPRTKGFIGDPFDTMVPITENSVRYMVDVENGQKTGFFLDQKDNRRAIARLCTGGRVLDCFTHTGSFGLNAAMAGAAEVTSVDASDLAIAQAAQNASLNGFFPESEASEDDASGGKWLVNEAGTRLRYQCADIFDLLPALHREGEEYDVVILDPPAFTKSRRTADNAEKGYREINTRALKLLPRGGWFATCSCSHFMPSERFEKMLRDASRDANVSLMQVEARQQAPDHPILWNVPETDYLKFYLFRVV